MSVGGGIFSRKPLLKASEPQWYQEISFARLLKKHIQRVFRIKNESFWTDSIQQNINKNVFNFFR